MANKDEEQGMDEVEDESSYDDDEDYDEDYDEEEDDFDDDEDDVDEDDVDEEEGYDEEAEDDEFEDDDDFGAEDDGEADPFWWTPHVVLAVLLLIGVLGAFGFFNKSLGFLAAVPAEQDQGHGDVATAEPVKKPMAKPKKGQRLGPDKAKPGGEVFGAKHLLVQYKGSKRAGATISRSKEEAKKRAEEAAGKAAALAKASPKIADRSKEFSELVGKYSDEPGAARRGGDLGRFRKGSMVPQFQAAVEKLKRGDVSGVVETPFGYHVILRTF